MGSPRTVVGLLLLLLAGTAAGCTGGVFGGDEEPAEIGVPTWSVGDWWQYAYELPGLPEVTSRLVVTEHDAPGGLYQIGLTSRVEAQRHAVLNHNPFLGRVTTDSLRVYENGVAQPVLNFPIEDGDRWTFDLLGVAGWQAQVTSVSGSEGRERVTIEAEAGPQSLIYVFDAERGFLQRLEWTTNGDLNLRYTLVDSGSDHIGECFFLRAEDLYENTWSSSSGDPEIELRDTFFDAGHPRDGAFDELIYHLTAEVADEVDAAGALTLRDRGSSALLDRTWQAGEQETGTVGTVPSNTGEYSLTVALTGLSEVHLILAGGIEYSWILT